MFSHFSARSGVLLFASVLPLLGSAGAASAQLDAYFTTGTYTLDATDPVIGDAFVGEDSTGHYTDKQGHPYNPTVNLVNGGSVGFGLYANNSSQVNVSGGSIRDDLQAFDSSRVNVTGGNIHATLEAFNNSQVSISGGSLGSLNARFSSQVNISGGSISNSLFAYNSSQVSISGGSVAQALGVNFYDGTTGSFTLVGSNLTATIIGTDTFYGGTDYSLSGTLAGGTNLKGYVLNVQTGSTFTLHNVPAPGSLSVFGGLWLSGMGYLRRKRHARS